MTAHDFRPDLPTEPPASRAEARARITMVDDSIAAIRAQVAAADMKRQAGARFDPDWFHRAKTALRHLRRERAELVAQAAALPGPKDQLKDRIISVVREEYDDEAWARVLEAARSTAAEAR